MRMRAERNNGRLKENTEIRKGIARHPGLDMFHPGVGHKKKANRTNGTGRKQYGHIQGKEIQTEKVNTILKNISVHCFCTANQSSFF